MGYRRVRRLLRNPEQFAHFVENIFFSSENAETASKSPSDPLNTVFRLN